MAKNPPRDQKPARPQASRGKKKETVYSPKASSAPYPHDKGWLVAAAIMSFALTALCYGASIKYPMLFDDHHSIGDNRYIRNMGNVGAFFYEPVMFSNEPERRMYRPLVLLTYALNYAISGNNTPTWHLFSYLLHAINGFLVYLILEIILRSRRAAMALAAVFLVHPVVVESVAYLSSRSTLMAGTSIFSALYFFLRGMASEKNRKWPVLIALSYFLGILSKENVFMLPFVLLAAEYSFGATPQEFISGGRWRVHLPVWIIAVVYILFRTFVLDLATVVVARPERSFASQIMTQAGVWLDYLKKILWPVGLNAQTFAVPSTKLWNSGHPAYSQPIIWFAIWAILAWALLAGRKNKKLVFGALFSAVILLPETLTAMNQLSNDRRMYLPMLGLMIIAGSVAVSSGLRFEGLRKRIGVAACAMFIVFMAVMSMARTTVWRSEKTLWFDSISKAPGSANGWHGLAYVYGQEARYDDAIWALKHALYYEPDYAPSLRLMGGLLLTKKQPKEALPYLERSITIEPLAHRGWYNLGLAQSELGMRTEAIGSYKKAISMNQFYAEPHNNLGGIYANTGMLDEALKEFEEAVRLAPDNKAFRDNLDRFRRELPQLRAYFRGGQ